MKGIHTILFISLFFWASCNQDPIFTMISNEVEPKDPLINGSPSKIVKTSDGTTETIYVANGKLWKYSVGGGGWSQAGGPSNVYDIAAAGPDLYMLSISESGCSVYKRGTSGTYTQIPNNSGYSMIQGIYSNGDGLYAGGMDGGAYAILHIESGVLKVKYPIGSPLTGVAGNYYATARGVYTIDGNTLVNSTSGYTIAGIIDAETGKIIAVSSGGMIFEITSPTSVKTYETGNNFTGALAVYTP
ncbi:MAG: hypothetical protein LBB47_06905, partial [Spirochaetaceae bacterium]|nr:hypothetical protein [Spirochaetaceae bacterium]